MFQVSKGDGSTVLVTDDQYNPTNEFLTLSVYPTLTKGETVTAYLRFTGYLNELMKGFYRSVYTNENDEKV